jgi:hypothetical protein
MFAGTRGSWSATATADDTARFLAGLQPSPNSSLAALIKDPAWISHARYFNSLFAREGTPIFPRFASFLRNI